MRAIRRMMIRVGLYLMMFLGVRAGAQALAGNHQATGNDSPAAGVVERIREKVAPSFGTTRQAAPPKISAAGVVWDQAAEDYYRDWRRH